MKICLIGTGSIGKRHILNLQTVCQHNNEALGIHLLRGTDRKLDDGILSAIEKEIRSVGELDQWYDAIFICNPTNCHYYTMKELRNRARYFFVEKPVFDSSQYNVPEMNLPKENEYYIACPLRYSAVITRAKQIAAQVKVISARSISSSYLPEWRADVDYRESYSARSAQGGGVRNDIIHEWDYLIDLFGFPLEVYSFSGHYSRLEIDSDDIAVYIARYKDKLVELHLDYFGQTTRRALEVQTDSGNFVFDIANNTISRDRTVLETFDEDPNEKYIKELNHFFNIIKGSEINNNSLYNAIGVLKVAHS